MDNTVNMNIDFNAYNMSTIGGGVMPASSGDAKSALPDLPTTENVRLLQRCNSYWSAKDSFRKRRRRAREYHRGDHYKDKRYDESDSTWKTEEQYLLDHGKTPLKQNQIRQHVKNIVGQYLTDRNKVAVISRNRDDATVGEMLTNTVQYILDTNQARRLDTRAFEEFLISGAMSQKVRYRYIPKFGREDVFIENRPIPQMFMNDNIKDPRLTDMDLIGEFYDVPLDRLKAAFAKTDEDSERLEQIYAHVLDRDMTNVGAGDMFTADRTDNLDFYNPIEPDLCRVFEVWRRLSEKRLRCHDWLDARRFTATIDQKARIDQINQNRIYEAARQGVPQENVPLIEYTERIEEFWHVKFLSPFGHTLFESETEYEHKEHPYILLLYPLIDGEVWGFVEDIIDQQRFINRLIMLMDFIIGSAAKGVLLVPEEAIPDDMDIDDIAEEWTKVGGVIKLKLKHGVDMPKEISSQASIPGVSDLLSLQLRFMDEISGIGASIQGQRAPSGTPAKLYAQETANSSLNTRDYFEAFNYATRERNWKVLKTAIQYYDEERKIALSGSNYSDEALTYTPEKARNAEVDVVMTQSADSPVYRGVIEDSLQQFLLNGFIDVEMYLRNSTLPFADKMLTDIQARKETMMNEGLQGMGAPLQAGLQGMGANPAQANPKTVDMLQRYISGMAG